jgi:hypothetical protein
LPVNINISKNNGLENKDILDWNIINKDDKNLKNKNNNNQNNLNNNINNTGGNAHNRKGKKRGCSIF